MENACAASDGQTAVTVNHGEWIYRYIIPDGDVAAVGFNADMGEDVCAIPDRYSAAWAVESETIEAEMSVKRSLRREICDVILVPDQIDVRSAEPHQMRAASFM